jgi:hypothetical protein
MCRQQTHQIVSSTAKFASVAGRFAGALASVSRVAQSAKPAGLRPARERRWVLRTQPTLRPQKKSLLRVIPIQTRRPGAVVLEGFVELMRRGVAAEEAEDGAGAVAFDDRSSAERGGH